jgi:hypothetical protein
MRSRLLPLFVVALIARAPSQGMEIERLAWLQGCWQASSPRRVIEENWTAPRGRSMIGVGRTIRGDSLIEYELVVVRQQPGRLTYEAHPSGQAGAVFTAQAAADSMVVFENLAHDFPQRVGYRRLGGDSLIGWIEGTRDGRARRIDFPYARVACATR